MATIIINSVTDLANARNLLRKEILDQNWSPQLCVRAVAALTSLGELMLRAHITGTVETEIAAQKSKGVWLKSNISKEATIEFNATRSQLERAVDTIEVEDKENQLHITLFIQTEGSIYAVGKVTDDHPFN
jgi:hypothetical protein